MKGIFRPPSWFKGRGGGAAGYAYAPWIGAGGGGSGGSSVSNGSNRSSLTYGAGGAGGDQIFGITLIHPGQVFTIGEPSPLPLSIGEWIGRKP